MKYRIRQTADGRFEVDWKRLLFWEAVGRRAAFGLMIYPLSFRDREDALAYIDAMERAA